MNDDTHADDNHADDKHKEPQATPPEKHSPPRVADGPPPTRQGRKQYDEETLEESSHYAEERSEEGGKPYTAETEALTQQARKQADNDNPRADEDQT